MHIDLNVDAGEALTPREELVELALVPLVSSINIACGAHAGDIASMRRLVAVARSQGVNIGAHPGYPDPAHRGRQPMTLAPDAVRRLVRDQVATLATVAEERGARLAHVKPHGALYNQAAADPALAGAIARATARFSRDLLLFGLASSEPMASAAADAGLRFVPEAFADRRYLADGSLQPRSEPGSVLVEPA